MKNPTAKRRAAGFTLLEVLVATMIASLAIGGAVVAVGQIVDQRYDYRQRLTANAIGWNRLMEQYQLVEGWVSTQDRQAAASGSETAVGQVWQWQLTAEATFGENFYRYQVDVRQGEEGPLMGSSAAYFIVPANAGVQ